MAKKQMDKLPPVHPGEDIRVPPRRITKIVHGKRAVTADIALRLARFFSMSAQFWMNLQSRYQLEVAQDEIGDRLAAK